MTDFNGTNLSNTFGLFSDERLSKPLAYHLKTLADQTGVAITPRGEVVYVNERNQSFTKEGTAPRYTIGGNPIPEPVTFTDLCNEAVADRVGSVATVTATVAELSTLYQATHTAASADLKQNWAASTVAPTPDAPTPKYTLAQTNEMG